MTTVPRVGPRSERTTLPIAALCAALAAALPATIMGLRINPDPLGQGLLNPDSAMRLVRLHDIIEAATPLHAVIRDGAGPHGTMGTVLHWSHALDSLLLLLAAPLAPLLGWDAALHAAGMLLGPLGLAGLGIAVAWTALPLAGRGWAWLGAFAAGAAPVIGGYGMPGVVHHHVLLALAAVMAGGWTLRLLRGADPVRGGIALGAWAAAGLWLSPESIAFSLMAMGALWAAWTTRPSRPLANALLACGATFAALAAAAWAVDPPAPGYAAIEPDRISLPFVLLAADTLVIALLARLGAGRPATLACGLATALAWSLAFPQMLRGTEGLMDPDSAAAFFSGIAEMLPVQGLDGALETLLGGIFATAVLAAVAIRRPTTLTLYTVACATALVALAASHLRFAAYPAVAGAVALPIALAWISRTAAPAPLLSLARLAMVLPLLLGPILAPIAASASPRATPRLTLAMPCTIDGAAALLRDHPGAIVLAGVNETPDLLYRTRIRTVGSLYHRNHAAFMRLRAAWRSVPGAAPSAALLATGATLVLACPGEPRSSLVEGLPETTLLDRLAADAPPTWLRRLDQAGGFVLYAMP